MVEGFNFYPWLAALALLVLANNATGMIQAAITKTFDKAKALAGFGKALGVAVSLVAIFYAGTLIPDVVFTYQDFSFSIAQILGVLMFTAIAFFAVKAVKSLAELMGIKVSQVDKIQDSNEDNNPTV
mgnify:CR=1 FL=1